MTSQAERSDVVSSPMKPVKPLGRSCRACRPRRWHNTLALQAADRSEGVLLLPT